MGRAALCRASLTLTWDESALRGALTAGADGYVSKEASISELTTAIRGVHDGDAWVDRRVLLRWLRGDVSAGGASAAGEADTLTAREREILGLLASGGTNKEIARTLSISDKTVKTHLNNIFRKLGVTRRLQAVLYAVRHGHGRGVTHAD
jgi:two-component system nitrate/nitrite response regulator NarL